MRFIFWFLFFFFCCSILLCGTGYAATGLDRVKETKTLRCGYMPYEPFIIVNPNTKEISGVTIDYMKQVGARAGYKVEFVAEVNIDQIVPSLDSGKIDAFCVPCSPDSNWVNVLNFPALLGGMPYYTYVRADNKMTDEEIKTARFVTVDGFVSAAVTRIFFPEASYIGLTQTTSVAEQYDQLKYNKADAFVNEPISAENYIRNNPNVIKRFSDVPVVVKPFFLVAPKNDQPLSNFIDQTFNISVPSNKETFGKIMQTYKVNKTMLLIGDECKHHTADKAGELYCAPPLPSSSKEAVHE